MVDTPRKPTETPTSVPLQGTPSSSTETPEADAPPPPKPGLPWKRLVLFGGIGFALLGGLVTAYFIFKPFHSSSSPSTSSPSDSFFADFPEMLVNLRSDGSKETFMKVDFTFELESKQDMEAFEKVIPVITDKFQVYFRELELKDLENPGGLEKLREELLLRANTAVAPLQIKNILFKEFLVQ